MLKNFLFNKSKSVHFYKNILFYVVQNPSTETNSKNNSEMHAWFRQRRERSVQSADVHTWPFLTKLKENSEHTFIVHSEFTLTSL